MIPVIKVIRPLPLPEVVIRTGRLHPMGVGEEIEFLGWRWVLDLSRWGEI